jgi:hypothetical protein
MTEVTNAENANEGNKVGRLHLRAKRLELKPLSR